MYVDPTNWENFTPHGASGVVSAAGVVFFSYVGFDGACARAPRVAAALTNPPPPCAPAAVSTLAGEVSNPQRDLPIGIISTLGVATFMYVAVSIVLTGMVPSDQISVESPLSSAFTHVGAGWASKVVAFGSITTLTATTLCSLFGQPRIYFR